MCDQIDHIQSFLAPPPHFLTHGFKLVVLNPDLNPVNLKCGPILSILKSAISFQVLIFFYKC